MSDCSAQAVILQKANPPTRALIFEQASSFKRFQVKVCIYDLSSAGYLAYQPHPSLFHRPKEILLPTTAW
jgi:hypothetical protein